ncbi:MAG: glycosyltransferase family 1 protein [Candidatus Erginobacter occultus]|nr:glycosyltransferase family 1 protein [Candidatus Erginobacter occultus]
MKNLPRRKIGIDARWIFPAISGVGRVTEKLITNLAAIDRENDYFLFFYDPGLREKYSRRWEFNPRLHPVSVPWGIFSPGGQWGIARRAGQLKLDIFHSTNYFLPLLLPPGVKAVATVHDLIPLKFPHFTPRAWKTRFHPLFRWVLSRSVKRADRVITVSNHTRRDLVADLGLPEEKISVVYNGIDASYRPLAETRAREMASAKLGFTGPYLFYVGRFDPYKNVVGLIRAFGKFLRGRTDSPRLVLAGHPDPRYPQAAATVRELHLSSHVVFLDGVEEEELVALYNRARILVLPSLYEGFGLPPLEAMACGTPVIVSDRGSLPEVVGEAGIIIDPENPEALAAAIGRLWDSEELRRNLRDRGLARAREFSWEKTARETLKIYRQLVDPLSDSSEREGPAN